MTSTTTIKKKRSAFTNENKEKEIYKTNSVNERKKNY